MGSPPELLAGLHPVGEALRAGRRRLLRLRLRADRARPGLEPLASLAEGAGVPVAWLPEAELRRGLRSDVADQGAVLEAEALPTVALAELFAAGPGPVRLLALDGVEDPQNLGALLRVAEAAGVAGVVLTDRRAPPLGPAVSRASAGALEWVRVARVPNLVRALRSCQEAGFWIVGLDHELGEDLYASPDKMWGSPLVFVLGAEGRGLRRGVRDVVDHPLRVPMRGRVSSLNVATAGAVALFEAVRRTRYANALPPHGETPPRAGIPPGTPADSAC